eukprot:scaffold34609_cov146-Amphora_coffeaeformis.AAC.9
MNENDTMYVQSLLLINILFARTPDEDSELKAPRIPPNAACSQKRGGASNKNAKTTERLPYKTSVQ